eukprot:UN06533
MTNDFLIHRLGKARSVIWGSGEMKKSWNTDRRGEKEHSSGSLGHPMHNFLEFLWIN